MAARRPASVLVIAIIQIILGSLGVLGALCSPLAFLRTENPGDQFRNAPPPGMNPGQASAMAKYMDASQPSLTVLALQLPVAAVLSGLMLASGVGMVQMRPFGRTCGLLWAVGSIIFQLSGLGYVLFVQYPALAEAAEQFQQSTPPGAGPGNILGVFVTALVILTSAGVACTVVYAVAVVYVLNRPEVVAGFGNVPTLDEVERPGDRMLSDDRPEIDR